MTVCTRFIAVLTLLIGVISAPLYAETLAKGIVFHDSNGNGKRNAGEKRLAGVGVSNGVDVVETDSKGRYEIPVTADTIIFVIKNWSSSLDIILFLLYIIQ